MTDQNNHKISILLAEDDDDDAFLIDRALQTVSLSFHLTRVIDGEALLETLNQCVNPGAKEHLPHLVLLDLNMPRKTGLEALKEIKEHPAIRHIPIVVFTTAKAKEDSQRAYDMGVNWFITKPINPTNFVETIQHVVKYWFEVAKPPSFS